MATDLTAATLPINGTISIGTGYEAISLSSVLPEFWVYVQHATDTTARLSYSGGADAGVPIPTNLWTRVWRRAEGATHGQVVYIKCTSATTSVHYADSVEASGMGDIDVNVDLDPATDGVTIWGSDDGGTTPRIVLTDSGGRQVVIGSVADGSPVAHPPVLMAGQDGTNVQSLKTDTTGRLEVVGGAADGAALAGNPVPVAGVDGAGNVQSVLTDTAGSPEVVGQGASGAARSGNPVAVAGSDGTNARDILTDTSGRPRVVGAADAGSAVAGSPVRVGASDGSTTRDVLSDGSGRLLVSGAAADGAALAGNPVLVAGGDGTNAQTLLVDTTGAQRIVGTADDGAAAVGSPVQVAGKDGVGNVQALLVDTTGRPLVAQPTAADLNCTEASAADIKTAVQLLDDAVSTTGSAIPAKGFQVTGSDGTNARVVKTDSDGHVQVDVLSSALPSGAATESTLGDVKTSVQLIDDSVATLGSATPAKGLVAAGSDGTNARALAVSDDGNPVTLDYVHQKIHLGKHFVFADYDNDVDIAGPKYWRITTPNSAVRIHFMFEASCGGSGGLWQLYENPTIDAAGTAGSELNNDRNSGTAADAACYYDTTTTLDGTLIWVDFVGTSGGPTHLGGKSSTRMEFVLEQNEDYILKFTATADNTPAGVVFAWYEE